VADIEDVPVNGNDVPLGITPDAPNPETAHEVAPSTGTPVPVDVPAEQLAVDVPQAEAAAASEIAVEPEPAFDMGLTAQLAALSIDEPAAEIVPAAEGAQVAAVGVEPVTDATEALEPAAEAAVAEAAVQPADGEGAEPSAEGEPADSTEVLAPVGSAEGEPAAESLDDIAPGTVAVATVDEPEGAVLADVEAPLTKVSWWPFVGYVVVWLGAAAYAVWQLEQLPTGMAAYETNFYSMTMLGGLALLAVGPVLILVVWLASWIGRTGARIGLMFISALMKGALATMLGAMIWMGALLLIDYLRLGRPF
jgi:hypothetical protein